MAQSLNCKHKETVCADPYCERIFLKKPFTNRKYCDICSEQRNNKTYRPRVFKCTGCNREYVSLRRMKTCGGVKDCGEMVEVTNNG